MRAGGGRQGRGDGGESPGLHKARREAARRAGPRKVGDTVWPALTAGGQSPRKGFSSTGLVSRFGSPARYNQASKARVPCPCSAPSLVARSPLNIGEAGGFPPSGRAHGTIKVCLSPDSVSLLAACALAVPSRGSSAGMEPIRGDHAGKKEG